MSKLSKYFFALMIAALLCVVGYRYYQYVYMRNFILDVNVACDPVKESCFTADCNASDPSCDTTTYKKVEILAHNAPKCLEEHSCQNFSCDSINSCKISTCSTDSLADGEKCANANTNATQ